MIAGQRYVVTPEQVGLTSELIESLDELSADEQRRLVEAVLYGRVEYANSGVLTFRSLDDRVRYTLTTDETGRIVPTIGDLT